MKKTVLLIAILFAIGCNNQQKSNDDNLPIQPSSVIIERYVNALWLSDYYGIPMPFDNTFRIEANINLDVQSGTYWATLSDRNEEILRNAYPKGREIHCVAQCVQDFHIYADKVLWGVEAGEPLEDYFVYANQAYDFPITYPNGDIDFTRDWSIDNQGEIKNILRKDYMIPMYMFFVFKEVPAERYDEVTFSVYLRTGDGKEFTASTVVVFEQ